MSETSQVKIPDMCQTHRYRLVKTATYGPNDAWQALIVASQIALFQAATCTPSIQKKLEGDITKIDKIGCFACRLPHRFGAILRLVTRSRNLGEIKKLGESWVAEAANGE